MSATTGSDPTGNLGYYTDPLMGIQNAVNLAESGDTVNAAAGTYNENVVLNKSLTLAGAGRDDDPSSNTIINAVQTDQPVIAITTGNVVVKNLQVTGANTYSLDNEGYHFGTGILIAGPNDINHVTLDNVASRDNYEGLYIDAENGNRISDVNANGIKISDSKQNGVYAEAYDGSSISGVNLNNAQISGSGS